MYFWLRFIIVNIQKSLKLTFKPGFWVQNHPLNLCSSAVDSQKLLCSQKAAVKCSYSRFLVYSIQYMIYDICNCYNVLFWDKSIVLSSRTSLSCSLCLHQIYTLEHDKGVLEEEAKKNTDWTEQEMLNFQFRAVGRKKIIKTSVTGPRGQSVPI